MTDPHCPDPAALIESLIDRVLTQYRESPHLLGMIRTYLGQVCGVYAAVCDLPEHFDLDTAVGEQLTWIGERMGWPRCHCVCLTQPVFGFDCEGYASPYTITGFCEGPQTWASCGPFSDSDLCLYDDAIYRQFLRVRRYQMLGLYDKVSLEETLKIFWGETAWVVAADHGRVVIAPGRPLTADERILIQLQARVLPIAPGVALRVHFGWAPVFGFGPGWGVFCGDPEASQPVFGFPCEEGYLLPNPVTGLCDDTQTWLACAPLTTEQAGEMMCPVDVRPYDCVEELE